MTDDIQALREQVDSVQNDLNRAVSVLERVAYAFEFTIMGELQAIRLRQDELADVNLTLVEALWESRGQNDRLEREVKRLRCLADNERLRRERLNRDTPPDGVKIPKPEHHSAHESDAPPDPDAH